LQASRVPWGSRQPILNLAFLLGPRGPAETPAYPPTSVATGHAADPVLSTIQRLDRADAMFKANRHRPEPDVILVIDPIKRPTQL
jgi:hypothetical protein